MSRYDEDTGSALEVLNPCELCGDPMEPERIGSHSRCLEREARSWLEETSAIMEQDLCICWPTGFCGRSVCGVPCPVHTEA